MSALTSTWKRIFAVFKARNLEFFRDKGSLGWSLVMPIIIIIAISAAFDGDGKAQYKVGVMHGMPDVIQEPALAHENESEKVGFFALKHVEFVPYEDLTLAQIKVQRHSIDLLVDWQSKQYWVNQTSPKGYVIEQLLLGQTVDYQRQVLTGKEVRYIDWLIPGILGMNIMFGSLMGASYVIVRYRKNSVLKRLKATPLTATEFMIAQVFSRLFIVVSMASIVFTLCNFIFDFYMLGSYLTLLIVAVSGALCLISLGLLISCRSQSEELVAGISNFTTWPMMLLSGVWFSLEGASDFVVGLAQIFPLTHMLNAARAVMTDGAGLADLHYELGLLLGLSVIFIATAGYFFKWEGEGR
ncbi:ABC transporter permease [Alteromonas sp. a30]|uniref:ABC transporter permease n=1 Tax=Alteromonas sp. a30 TaxID=2730917 RepID=UPI002280E737|nr:ABC transporter permease [Alteromonas sp. a30]MCY7296114.1 ABC transporter permease [Alteromonas sp. a30]